MVDSIFLNFRIILCFGLCFIHTAVPRLSNDPDRLLNWCLDAKHHKTLPGPEDELHSQCTPWKDRSCCTTNTTKNLHISNLYKFNYNHCSQHKNLSASCHRHFIQDECFYECSPNIGSWVVQVSMKTRNERFFEVPLCASDCDAWFNACKDDFTCSDKWTINSKDQNGQLTPCHSQDDCKTFAEIFKTSKNFCEKVWDHSWKYTNDSDPCMRIWFDGNQGNPNDKVAKYYVDQFLNGSTSQTIHLSVVISSIIFTSYFLIRSFSLNEHNN